MRILEISGKMSPYLQELGHETLCLMPEPGLYNVAEKVSEANFCPDVLIQVETLAPRVILTGLNELDCLKVYWARDPQLNFWWQVHYAKLFDVFALTQKDLLDSFSPLDITRIWLPWHGWERPLRSWAQRDLPMTFIGRLTEFRRARNNFINFLQEHFDIHVETEIPPSFIPELYARTKLAPNESFVGEVNIRLFEAASHGCLCLTPAGGGVEELFEPGKEILTYESCLELQGQIEFFQANSKKAMSLGVAARERVVLEHLFIHRVEKLCDTVIQAPRIRHSSEESEKAELLALALLVEARLLPITPKRLAELLERMTNTYTDSDILAAAIALLYFLGRVKKAEKICALILKEGLGKGHLKLNLTASTFALSQGDFVLGQVFWRLAFPEEKTVLPATPRDLLFAWAKRLAKEDLIFRSGFPFNLEKHLPATAVECLWILMKEENTDLESVRFLESLLRDIDGMAYQRLDCLSLLTLHNRSDWRLGQILGLVNLKVFRAKEGLEELLLARDLALKAGRLATFEKTLAAGDRGGLISRTLQKFV